MLRTSPAGQDRLITVIAEGEAFESKPAGEQNYPVCPRATRREAAAACWSDAPLILRRNR